VSGGQSASDESMRVIADHLRAMTFLIGDGVTPSNEWRGYVLRKIMRRAMRHGKTLGVSEPFLHSLTTTVIEEMRHAYPVLQPSRDTIITTVLNEEKRFEMVLNAGLPKLEDAINHRTRAIVPVHLTGRPAKTRQYRFGAAAAKTEMGPAHQVYVGTKTS